MAFCQIAASCANMLSNKTNKNFFILLFNIQNMLANVARVRGCSKTFISIFIPHSTICWKVNIFVTFWNNRWIFEFRQKGCPEEELPLFSRTWISLLLQVSSHAPEQWKASYLSTTFHLTKKSKLNFGIEELSKGGVVKIAYFYH